jgi:hypothetical protein
MFERVEIVSSQLQPPCLTIDDPESPQQCEKHIQIGPDGCEICCDFPSCDFPLVVREFDKSTGTCHTTHT